VWVGGSTGLPYVYDVRYPQGGGPMRRL